MRSVKFIQNRSETSRIERSFKDLQAHKAYRMSFWLKTENYGGGVSNDEPTLPF
jgi:hypothetical protein